MKISAKRHAHLRISGIVPINKKMGYNKDVLAQSSDTISTWWCEVDSREIANYVIFCCCLSNDAQDIIETEPNW